MAGAEFISPSRLKQDFLAERATGERGAMLILIALAIVPLILLIAMAIDMTRVGVSSTEQKRLASSMALAAIEKIQVEKSTVHDYGQLVDDGAARAAEVARLSRNQILAKNITVSAAASDSIATMRYGRWWAEEPLVVVAGNSELACPHWSDLYGGNDSARNYDASCPCPNGEWKGACFEENLKLDAPDIVDSTNAVEVTLRTDPRSPIQSLFSSVVGMIGGKQDVLLANSSIATIVPRNGIFLIDLSRSVYFDTHLPIERSTAGNVASSSEYVFALSDHPDPMMWPGGQTLATCSAGITASPCYNPADPTNPNCAIRGQKYDRVYNGTAGGQAPYLQNTRGGETAATVHYKNDYQCVKPTGVDGNYLIDNYVDFNPAGGDYLGPEPLNTILDGIHTALEVIESRSVAGDRMGVIAFDQDVNAGGREIPPVRPGDEDFELLKRITNVQNPDTDGDPETNQGSWLANRNERLMHYFFPREGSFTDISGALWEAKTILTNLSTFQTSSNFVAMFTDGLPSCSHGADRNWLDGADAARTLSYDTCLNPTSSNVLYDPDSWAHDWWTGWHHHEWGLQEATQLLSGQPEWVGGGNERHTLNQAGDDKYIATYKQLGIQFHLFQVGNEALPSTPLLPKPDGSGCMTGDDWNVMPNADTFGTAPYAEQMFAQLYGHDPFFKDDPQGVNCLNIDQWSFTDLYYANNCQYYIPTNRANIAYSYTFASDFLFRYGVQPTGGMYVPVRRPCYPQGNQLKDAPTCAAGGFVNYLNAKCIEAAPDPQASGAFGGFQWITKASDISDPTKKTAHLMMSRYDGGNLQKRRLLICDPLCRSGRQQVEDAIKKIFEDNPYVLVK